MLLLLDFEVEAVDLSQQLCVKALRYVWHDTLKNQKVIVKCTFAVIH